MQPARLFAFVMVAFFSALQAWAQTLPAQRSSSVPDSKDALISEALISEAWISSDNSPGEMFRLNLETPEELALETARSNNFIADASEKYPPERGEDFGSAREMEATCYSIRSYVVVRDNPYSDATHRDGYSTCVPTSRIRLYTATEHRH